ncbi:alpha/beta hydrolase [Frigoriflavimonas asaccharolytica]|uniref:Serine aminopeptidase S33 domain-containing protein n=1 Tax=Frigoriflavimonas asaccharolytica TaxID=2735899 RepID=A0A8J8GAH4_9FLAO|nr:alpha/beta hydrolase [Frigoriflavimonas asaccharolytica]NRS92380.1 hypothetical protein [Frigoriflavimonas asaccharolytica]
MRKTIIIFTVVAAAIYIAICTILYFYQEKIIFIPEKLGKNFTYNFPEKFEEINVKMEDGTQLNGVLFKAEKSKGLLFYLHGNGGSVNSWAHISKLYTDLGYDLFLLDFRGYGKSGGAIASEKQIFKDNQTVYNFFKKKYTEDKIVVLGYSIGTGLAAKLASENNPKLLILQAPYYSLTEIMEQNFSFIPSFILKYKFATSEYLKKCKMPVVVFHGTNDEVIPFENSKMLEQEFKKGDVLVPLDGEIHSLITDNLEYQAKLENILNN